MEGNCDISLISAPPDSLYFAPPEITEFQSQLNLEDPISNSESNLPEDEIEYKISFFIKGNQPIQAYQFGFHLLPGIGNDLIEIVDLISDNTAIPLSLDNDISLSDWANYGLIKTIWVTNFIEHPQGIETISDEPTPMFSLIIKSGLELPTSNPEELLIFSDEMFETKFINEYKYLSSTDFEISFTIETLE